MLIAEFCEFIVEFREPQCFFSRHSSDESLSLSSFVGVLLNFASALLKKKKMQFAYFCKLWILKRLFFD